MATNKIMPMMAKTRLAFFIRVPPGMKYIKGNETIDGKMAPCPYRSL
jgi:hypothetical protein